MSSVISALFAFNSVFSMEVANALSVEIKRILARKIDIKSNENSFFSVRKNT